MANLSSTDRVRQYSTHDVSTSPRRRFVATLAIRSINPMVPQRAALRATSKRFQPATPAEGKLDLPPAAAKREP